MAEPNSTEPTHDLAPDLDAVRSTADLADVALFGDLPRESDGELLREMEGRESPSLELERSSRLIRAAVIVAILYVLVLAGFFLFLRAHGVFA